MTCKHHPSYDSTSGEPTGTIEQVKTRNSADVVLEYHDAPCGGCWQAREHYQAHRAHNYHNQTITLEKRIKELEAQIHKLLVRQAKIHHISSEGMTEMVVKDE